MIQVTVESSSLTIRRSKMKMNNLLVLLCQEIIEHHCDLITTTDESKFDSLTLEELEELVCFLHNLPTSKSIEYMKSVANGRLDYLTST